MISQGSKESSSFFFVVRIVSKPVLGVVEMEEWQGGLAKMQ